MGERALKLTLVGGTTGTVGHVLSLSGSDMTRESIDVSDMDSSGSFREHMAGLMDAGDISLELSYDGTASGVADSLFTAYTFGTTESWTIGYVDTTSDFEALGFITALGVPQGGIADQVTQSLTIKFTGVPEYTDAAS